MLIKERIKKFTFKNPITKCWQWIGSISPSGYARLQVDGENANAHRISYLVFKGKIPKGKYVLHKCDNRSCVNPNHLFLGTHQDNMVDRNTKNRQAKGESNGNVKITERDVLAIRSAKGRQVDIAKRFKINQTQVSKIKLNKVWKHIKSPVD